MAALHRFQVRSLTVHSSITGVPLIEADPGFFCPASSKSNGSNLWITTLHAKITKLPHPGFSCPGRRNFSCLKVSNLPEKGYMADRDNFQDIVRSESGRVYNLAYRLCGNCHQAKDITQEVFLRAFRSYGRFEGRSSVSTYLYRITCNVWKNSLRKKSALNFTSWSADLNAVAMEDFADRRASPHDKADKSDRQRLVRRCIDALTPGDREIIVLRDMEGRSYEEISVILNCRTGTVKSRLARARRRLLEKMLPLREELFR